MNEEWKDIPGYEGYYQVSNLGRVKSLERVVIRNNAKVILKQKLCKLYITKTSYLEVELYKNSSKKKI